MSDLPQPLLIGMVHLLPLPGAPASKGSLDDVVAHALTDARTLREAGFPALMTENFGDAPFTAGELEPITVAAMSIVVREIIRETGLPVGVNCLRNDARAAIGIAAATGAQYIRVNVHTGVAATDQGVIEGKAYTTVRELQRLCPKVRLFADVHVKHAQPVNQPDIALAAEETAYRGRADAIIVSGATTGRAVDLRELERAREAVPDKIVLVGSGADPTSIRDILKTANGAIVGSALKPDGEIPAPISLALAQKFIEAARA